MTRHIKFINTLKNRITELFASGKKDILNIYFTAGFPELENTVRILKALEKAGADMVEIGMPYSDPLADGPTIQASSEKALANGMTLRKLFEQLEGIREEVSIPIMLMGYINPVMQYGVEKFVKKAAEIGIDGVILPDLPFKEYNDLYKTTFEANNLSNIFLVTPQTSDDRIKTIDTASKGFIYIVSTNSTTGNETKDSGDMTTYFERIQASELTNPTLIGFNIKDNTSFKNACHYSKGAIIGSAFIKAIENTNNLEATITDFVKKIKIG